MVIKSRQNPKVKALARLKTKKGRREAGAFLVEGAREIERALESPRVRPKLFVVDEENLSPAEQEVLKKRPEIEVMRVSPEVMAKIAYRENPGGLLLVAAAEEPKLKDLDPGENPLVLVAVGLEKPGNLGAVFRSADAAGASVLVADPRVEPWAPQTIRASTGTVFSVPFAVASGEEARRWLKERGLKVLATSPHAEKDYWQAEMRGPLAVVIGPEESGLEKAWLAEADEAVRVPMHGVADSLNASVTAALLLYEALRQRQAD